MITIGILRIIRRIQYIPRFIIESFTWEYESCKICGNSFRIRWQVKDELWYKVMNVKDETGGSLCLDCFIKKAESKGIIIDRCDVEMELFKTNEL